MPTNDDSPAGAPSRGAGRTWIGGVPLDRVTMSEAIDAVEHLVKAGRGGSVFTPNVDHVVECQDNPALREAYRDVSLSLADGMPVVWAARALGRSVPEKVSGSDLVAPLARRAALRGWRVFLLGGGDGVAVRAAERLATDHPGLRIAGTLSPSIDMRRPPSERLELLRAINEATPHIVLVALGAPKQELLIHELRGRAAPAVMLGIGASLDFVAGAVRRAPAWMSRVGLEWSYRLAREPRRLWRRYLVRDPRFLGVVLAELKNRRGEGSG